MCLSCQRADKLAAGHRDEKSGRDDILIHNVGRASFAMDNRIDYARRPRLMYQVSKVEPSLGYPLSGLGRKGAS